MRFGQRQGRVLLDILHERNSQDRALADGKIAHDCTSPTTADLDKLGVLVEEVGEVGKAIIEREGGARLREELIQVAAVAAAWAEGLTADIEGHAEAA